jgi:drug/metabolite transporter (DMT)-like permease
MARLVMLGALAALFFSSTFVLNRAMSLSGGPWVWTASLRYAFMLPILLVWTLAAGGWPALAETLVLFRRHPVFWIVSGSIGFGVFYACLAVASTYAPGWVVATTWQSTILATPLVLRLLGRKAPGRGVVLSALIFVGIVLVNVDQGQESLGDSAWIGIVAVLAAAVAYPLGNQMVWEARHGGGRRIPRLDQPALDMGRAPTLLLTLGSLPFWLVLAAVVRPPAPAAGQIVQCALVALLAGVVATSVFLRARSLAKNAYELAATDATQSLEVVFSLLGEIVLLQGTWPGPLGCCGIVLALVGLTLYVCRQA